MSDMVERVARALCEHREGIAFPNALARDSYLHSAKVALRAMREPNDDMLFAGRSYGPIRDEADLSNAYTQMIDRAIDDFGETA